MSDEPWTILRLLDWTTGFFKTRGSESPRLDAEILLAHARRCPRIELYTAFNEIPSDEERIAFREMVKRRGDGAPVAQLVGHREFYSLQFRVDENVLIPRPETEHLVIETIDRHRSLATRDPVPWTNRKCRILDIGTGSGAIAVTLAKNLPGVEVVAVDISPPALQIAQWNVDQHEVQDQVRLLQSDLTTALEDDSPFDIVCSNPPYISQSEFEALPPTVRDFEPKVALLSGPEGTEVIREVLTQSALRLHDHGCLVLELSPMIAESVAQMTRDHPAWDEPKLIKDLAGHLRILSVDKKPSLPSPSGESGDKGSDQRR